MRISLALLILMAGASSVAGQDRERPERPDPAQIFATADTNEDGFLDLAELTAFREKMPQGRRGPRGPRETNTEGAAPDTPEAQGQRGRGRGAPTAEDMLAFMDKNEDGKIAPDEFTLGNRGRRGGPGGGEGRRARPPQ